MFLAEGVGDAAKFQGRGAVKGLGVEGYEPIPAGSYWNREVVIERRARSVREEVGIALGGSFVAVDVAEGECVVVCLWIASYVNSTGCCVLAVSS